MSQFSVAVKFKNREEHIHVNLFEQSVDVDLSTHYFKAHINVRTTSLKNNNLMNQQQITGT